MNADQALERYFEIAKAYDGCDAETQTTRFGTLCCPCGPAAARAFFCTPNVKDDANSSCEAVAVGAVTLLLAELGLPYLQVPFTFALDSWRAFVTFAKAHGAYHTPGDGSVIRAGCIVHVEGPHGRHWYGTLEDLGNGAWRTFDGGKLTASGYQAAACTTHQLRGSSFDVTSGKPVVDFVDLGELLAALLPADVEPADSPVEG